MKVILYMAISVNGHITYQADDTDWVSETDWQEFDALMRDCGIMVMGKNAYVQFGEDFPCEGALNIVMTHDQELLKRDATEEFLFTDRSPKEVVALAEERGFNKLMLMGGMQVNTSFVKDGLVDEIWLSVHPLFLGEGKTVIEELPMKQQLELLGSKELSEGVVQLRYKVK